MTQKIYFTPGPSQLYHTYETHLKKALRLQYGSISHRSADFQKIYQETEESLREALGLPKNFTILFTSSATDIWERIIENLVVNSSHHFVNGSFSKRFYDFAIQLGKNSTKEEAEPGQVFESVSIPEGAELIAITQNETSTGFGFDRSLLAEIRKANPEKLIALDVVSLAPAVSLDYDLFDMAYLSVQKCFGMPAGLGVWVINDRAIEKAYKLSNEGLTKGTYRTLSSMIKYANKNQTPETPNVLGIYTLGKISQDMIGRGIQMIHNETTYKSTLLYQTLKESAILSPFIKSKVNQSKTVIVAECGSEQDRILKELNSKGMILGKGYGSFKEEHLRIANFPAHSKEQIELLCDYIKQF